jgi:hypothetical protein
MSLHPRVRATRWVVGAAACSALVLPVLSRSAGADQIPAIHPHVFALAPAGATKPDDITRLDDTLYVTYQNNAGKDGTPLGATSTVVAFDRSTAKVVQTYVLTGRCDGLTADPKHGRIFATVNEDLNSSLYVITPEASTPVKHYDYSPSPAQTGTDGTTNGGTDAVSIGSDGTVYVAHSNPEPTLPGDNNAPAVYTIKLDGSTAQLTPVFGVNDVAKVINSHPVTSTVLGLTDPDSNRFVPGPHGGTLIQVSQADSKFVFASHLHAAQPTLRQLNLTNASGDPTVTPQVDDIERVTGEGTLFAVDQATGTIYAVNTSGVAPGTWFVAQPKPSSGDLANVPALGVVNMKTGVVTHVDSTLGSPKGLLFVPASEDGR